MNENELNNALGQLTAEDSTKGERHYARKFKSAYVRVRKAMVLIAKSRKNIGSKEAVIKTIDVLNTVLNELEVDFQSIE